ncbi:tetratricopeptide repeat protein [Pseudoalteromonas luteoviolacea]|uniref:tetratricopeptide repeat protein n=1 Tax=Pseudoalteromonas luteoviolacea TaxID=43657 RepID=UPI001B3694B2|nr:tetratricopeptide repeat protein [Pseudoalteromonas luteoviolacea]MBQ4809917.1 tetratricopeptide repeat protein [Pseudoalteromonas luteoviolacea]
MNLKRAGVFSLIALLMAGFKAHTQDYQLELEPVRFVLPAYSEQYSDREVTLAPDEYELAEKLKSLLSRKDFKKVSEELATFYNIELSPALLMIKAQVHFSLKEYNNAEKVYKFVLKRKPQLVRAHEDLGQLYLINEDFEKAQIHFSNAIAYGSNSAMIHGQLGYLNLHKNGAFSALYAYQKAYSLEPENEQWQQGLLTSLVKAKMFPSALALLSELITKNKQNQSYWLTKAAIHLETQQSDKALTSLEYALLLGDLSHQNLLIMINLHFEQSQYDRAIALLKANVSKQTLEFSDVRSYLYWLNSANRWEDSEWLLQQFIGSDALTHIDKSTIAYTQAQILEANGKLVEADKLYKEALHNNANNEQALLSYAHLLLQQKDYIAAEQMFLRSEAFNSVNLHAMLGRAQLYINTDDIQSAYSLLLDVKNKYPDTQGIQNKIDILANIVSVQDANNL